MTAVITHVQRAAWACLACISVAGAEEPHWAFAPLSHSAVPHVADRSWPLDALDRFVLRKLEAAGLRPAGDADRHTWLRRVTLDLTGLPPALDDVHAFVTDSSPGAHERVVDRLLGSRAFGERWARHWLDLVGYADEIGASNNVPAVHAWRYRDYVIEAFNADRPYDQLIHEQIAGDLLASDSPGRRRRQIVATGFLVLGEINIVDADKSRLRLDVVDHQIDKIGKTFLAMTLACVRCHDHKFDPITLRDYYGLAGILGSAESVYYTQRGAWSDVVVRELPETDAERHEREARLRAHDEAAEAVKAEREAALAGIAELDRQLAAGDAPLAANQVEPLKKQRAELSQKAGALERRLLQLEFIRPTAPLAHAVRDAPAPADSPIYMRGNPYAPSEIVPRGFVHALGSASGPGIPAGQSGRLQLAEWLVGPAHPLTARVAVNRIWRHLFGQGLVASEDYLGIRGERPSHPQLLDHLARQFIDGGWSHKAMIRRIVLSRAYRMDSRSDPAAASRDPDNRLLWRMTPRRLEAEAIRDAVLAVSDSLLPCSGGPALALELPENINPVKPQDVNPASFSLSKYRAGQEHHRSIYLPIVRAGPQRGPLEILNYFDFPHPANMTGDRPVTTVPSQALVLMNGPLFKDAAGRLAAWALIQPGDERSRVTALYYRVLGRLPTEAEQAEALEFVAGDESSTAWAAFSRALLTCNEFLFRL